jgi:type IV pilus assembly protein PilO
VELLGFKIDELELDEIGSWPLVARVATIVVVCVTTISLGYLLDFGDKMTVLSKAEEKKAGLKTMFFETQRRLVNLEKYREELKLVENNLEKLTEQLPSKNEQAELLEDISQNAISNGLQLVTIKPGVEDNKGFYREDPVEFTVTGNFNGFGVFVSKVLNMNRIVTLHDFSIKKNDTSGKGPLMMVMIAKTYWAMGKGS